LLAISFLKENLQNFVAFVPFVVKNNHEKHEGHENALRRPLGRPCPSREAEIPF
jgi:hypothetical protein